MPLVRDSELTCYEVLQGGRGDLGGDWPRYSWPMAP